MIYFDNSATTYPKPKSVIHRMTEAMQLYSFNSGRSGYRESMRSAERIYAVREKLAAMFGFLPQNIVFTKNCTEALNMAIKGNVKQGDHILISSLEHNSVYRVVHKLFLDGTADYDIFGYSFHQEEILDEIRKRIKDNTRVLICMQASNVFGVTFPITEIGQLCRERGIRFIVDAAQGAGILPLNAEKDKIDILCAPGHKSLLGPMGIGFMAVREGIRLSTITEGGTGSASSDAQQPEFLPDRFEAGTLNNPGIIALEKGIDYINENGMQTLYHHEMQMTQYLFEELFDRDNVLLYTPKPELNAFVPIIAFNVYGNSSEKTAALLAKEDICVRAGYHCSPLAHKHFHTLDSGTVRISLGCFNTLKECNKFINVVKKL